MLRSAFVLPLLLAVPAFAADERFDLACVTETPSTSFVIAEDGDEVTARVVFHYGAEFAPAIEGIYTPHDLEVIAKRAKLATKLGDDVTYRWPKKNCRRHDDVRLECFGASGAEAGKNGEKILPFALYSGRLTEEGIGGKWDYVTMRMSFTVDGEGDPSLGMRYQRNECFQVNGAKAIARLKAAGLR